MPMQEDERPSLRNLFRVGQLVACTVLALGSAKNKGGASASKRVELSLLLSRLHEGLGLENFQEAMVNLVDLATFGHYI